MIGKNTFEFIKAFQVMSAKFGSFGDRDEWSFSCALGGKQSISAHKRSSSTFSLRIFSNKCS